MDERATPKSPQPNEDITLGDVGRLVGRKLKEMKTVFYLLITLAAASFLATLIPQHQPTEHYLQRYGPLPGHLIMATGLNHVSTTGWFLLLLAVLMLSLLLCANHLYRLGVNRWRLPAASLIPHLTEGSGRISCELRQSPEAALQTLLAASRQAGFRVWDRGPTEDRRCLYLVRHRWSAWGATLAHYAVFVIGVGALLGSLPGISVNDYLEVNEHQTAKGAPQHLPFDVRLNSFTLKHFSGSQHVENYYSDVSLLVAGKEVRRQVISVNRPLKYRGYYLVQSSWGLGAARVAIKGQDGKPVQQLEFPLRKEACPAGHVPGTQCWGVPSEEAILFLPEQRAALVAVAFYPEARRQGTEVIEQPAGQSGTPALKLVLVSRLPASRGRPEAALPPDRQADGGVAVSFTQMTAPDPGPGQSRPNPTTPGAGGMPHAMQELGWVLAGETVSTAVGELSFTGVTRSTGLGIRKDPGVPLVWTGFIVCLLGLAMVFYFPLQQGYVTVTPRQDASAGCQLSLCLRGGPLTETQSDSRRLLESVIATEGADALPTGRKDP